MIIGLTEVKFSSSGGGGGRVLSLCMSGVLPRTQERKVQTKQNQALRPPPGLLRPSRVPHLRRVLCTQTVEKGDGAIPAAKDESF